MSPRQSPNDDFDSPWKEALERFLEPFLAFFLPEAHADIDWSHPAEHLDAELRKVVREAESSNQRADYLVKVRLQGGEFQWVLIHIEIQSQVDAELGKRLFTYDYRIFDRYQVPVATLAVLGESREGWHPERFGWDLWGAGMEARFRVYQMLDWQGREAELEANPNPPWWSWPICEPERPKARQSSEGNGSSSSCVCFTRGATPKKTRRSCSESSTG